MYQRSLQLSPYLLLSQDDQCDATQGGRYCWVLLTILSVKREALVHAAKICFLPSLMMSNSFKFFRSSSANLLNYHPLSPPFRNRTTLPSHSLEYSLLSHLSVSPFTKGSKCPQSENRKLARVQHFKLCLGLLLRDSSLTSVLAMAD